MPDLTQSDHLRELRSVFPLNTRELQTIELRQSPMDVGNELDVVFVAAIHGDISSANILMHGALDALLADTDPPYNSIRFAVIGFRDISGPFVPIVETDFTTLTGSVDTTWLSYWTGSGFSGTVDAFGAIVKGTRLKWRQEATRVMILLTNSESSSINKTQEQALRALLKENVVFMTSTYSATLTSYPPLVAGTPYGAELTTLYLPESIAEETVEAVLNIGSSLDVPVFLVSDNASFAAYLETGEHVTFLQRSFALDPFSSGEEGTVSIPMQIDNTDLAVSRYIQNAKASGFPIEVRIRIYDANDPSGPQNDPPLRLFATEFEISGSTVSCQLSWIDLHNAPFPNEYYTPTKCPSLQ